MFKKIKERLPKDKSPEELDEHYREIERVGLDKSDFLAMAIAVFITIVLPLVAILGAFYGILYLLFIR